MCKITVYQRHSVANETFTLVTTEIECVVAVSGSGCTCVGSSRTLFKMWELLLRNVRFIQEFIVFDVNASLPV